MTFGLHINEDRLPICLVKRVVRQHEAIRRHLVLALPSASSGHMIRLRLAVGYIWFSNHSNILPYLHTAACVLFSQFFFRPFPFSIWVMSQSNCAFSSFPLPPVPGGMDWLLPVFHCRRRGLTDVCLQQILEKERREVMFALTMEDVCSAYHVCVMYLYMPCN